MRLVDSHQHFWSIERGDYGWLTPDLDGLYRDFGPEDIRPLMHGAGIAETVLVQAAPTTAETHYLLEIAENTEFVKAVVGWVDMESPIAAAQVAELAVHPLLRGLRPMIQDIPDPQWMLSDHLEPALRAIREHGLHFDALIKPEHLDAFLVFQERYPDLPVVIDHGAKPAIRDGAFADWADKIGRIAASGHACCKVSGLITEADQNWRPVDLKPYLDHLFACFGAERLMWGSDWPVVELAGGHRRWWEATVEYLTNFSERERARVLGATAREFYSLDEQN